MIWSDFLLQMFFKIVDRYCFAMNLMFHLIALAAMDFPPFMT